MKKIIVILNLLLVMLFLTSCKTNDSKELRINDVLINHDYSKEVTYEYVSNDKTYNVKHLLFQEFIEKLNNWSIVEEIDFNDYPLSDDYVKLSIDSNEEYYINSDGSLLFKINDKSYRCQENSYDFSEYTIIKDFKNLFNNGYGILGIKFDIRKSYYYPHELNTKQAFSNLTYLEYLIDLLDSSLLLVKIPYETYIKCDKREIIYTEKANIYTYDYPSWIYIKTAIDASSDGIPISIFINDDEIVVRYGDEYFVGLERFDEEMMNELYAIKQGEHQELKDKINELWEEYNNLS